MASSLSEGRDCQEVRSSLRKRDPKTSSREFLLSTEGQSLGLGHKAFVTLSKRGRDKPGDVSS